MEVGFKAIAKGRRCRVRDREIGNGASRFRIHIGSKGPINWVLATIQVHSTDYQLIFIRYYNVAHSPCTVPLDAELGLPQYRTLAIKQVMQKGHLQFQNPIPATANQGPKPEP